MNNNRGTSEGILSFYLDTSNSQSEKTKKAKPDVKSRWVSVGCRPTKDGGFRHRRYRAASSNEIGSLFNQIATLIVKNHDPGNFTKKIQNIYYLICVFTIFVIVEDNTNSSVRSRYLFRRSRSDDFLYFLRFLKDLLSILVGNSGQPFPPSKRQTIVRSKRQPVGPNGEISFIFEVRTKLPFKPFARNDRRRRRQQGVY